MSLTPAMRSKEEILENESRLTEFAKSLSEQLQAYIEREERLRGLIKKWEYKAERDSWKYENCSWELNNCADELEEILSK